MFSEKIRRKESGILLYGITPPKAQNTPEKIAELSSRRVASLQPLPIDAMVIYDLQDESARNSQERPFPFLPTLDSALYAEEYLQELRIPKIIYRSVGKFSPHQLTDWISAIQNEAYSTVFVGAPSREQAVQMKLPEAYQLWNQYNQRALLGGVTIPERHSLSHDEHLKIIRKMQSGCTYFISQCVYSVACTKNLISDLYFYCHAHQLELPTLLFTLTTCGSVKTVDFMHWLGINVPNWLKNELLHCQDILARSVDLCLEIAREIIDFCGAKSIPFGFNIESVSIRKDEIDASLYLLNQVDQMLTGQGLRNSGTKCDEPLRVS